MQSFWDKLPRPFYVLAPMADVTDPAYRRLIAEYGKPDVTWTEFVSADGLYHTREKKKKDGTPIFSSDVENPLMRDLQYSEIERPIVAQLFTGKPEMMEYAAALAVELGFDGVDINMGCPHETIVGQESGSACIRNPELAKKVIDAALRGVAGKLPVSVKTRLGYTKVEEYKEWLPHLLSTDISALTLHMRSRKEMSKVPAHWELAEEITSFCRARNPQVLLIGNGDLAHLDDARAKIALGFDGMMLGRAIFGNPWVFAGRKPEDLGQRERLEALAKLAEYFSDMKPPKHYALLKKHFKAFISGWEGAAELRARCMETNNFEEFQLIMESVISQT